MLVDNPNHHGILNDFQVTEQTMPTVFGYFHNLKNMLPCVTVLVFCRLSHVD